MDGGVSQTKTGKVVGVERVGRDRTIGAYHLDLMRGLWLTDDGMPILASCDTVPDDLLGFNYANGVKDDDVMRSNGVHFFLDDYQFERVWKFPEEYGERLRGFQCVLTPDYSLYRDMPLPMQRWNCYRSRFVGAVWQRMGLHVIPTLQWSTPESYGFAFDGMPTESVAAVSTVGVLNDATATRLWVQGFEEALRRLHPTLVLLYGRPIPDYTMPCEFIRYENHNIRRLKQWEEEEEAAPEVAEAEL